jgi:hypothetical protein
VHPRPAYGQTGLFRGFSEGVSGFGSVSGFDGVSGFGGFGGVVGCLAHVTELP